MFFIQNYIQYHVYLLPSTTPLDTTYAVNWSDKAQPGLVGHEVKVSMTSISRPSDFVISWSLFHLRTSYFEIMNLYDPWFDLKINIGHHDLYFMVQWFSLYLECYLIYGHPYLGLWISMTQSLTSKCQWPMFMVQWFYITSWRQFDVRTSYFGIMGQYEMTFDLKKM